MTPQQFAGIVTSIPANAHLLSALSKLQLRDCYLTAGCLFQPIWNRQSHFPDDWGIKDFDVIYFDDDVSWEAENAVIRRAAQELGPCGVKLEIRNQARVHLWYEQRFGESVTPLTSAKQGIDRFLIACTCVGIHIETGMLYAPYGVTEISAGILRMNPANPRPDLFFRKALDYQSRWPWLSILSPQNQ